jgi:predicted nucleic acid-binding Zn ribbon protein
MRRSKTISIAEALSDYIKEMNFEGKIKEIGVINSWESIVGKSIAIHTKKLYIKSGVLYVHLNSSVVRNELHMLKRPLIQKINEKAGSEVINDIVLR